MQNFQVLQVFLDPIKFEGLFLHMSAANVRRDGGKIMTIYGYARVSDTGPGRGRSGRRADGRRLRQGLSGEGSGAKTDRAELAKVIGRLEPGDVLVVTRLDRLARSTRDLLNVIDEVSKRGAGFRSLKDTWADTTSPHGRLMLTVLGGLAEFERELIRARTGEGRKRAQERGVRFGRPRKLTPFQRKEALPASMPERRKPTSRGRTAWTRRR